MIFFVQTTGDSSHFWENFLTLMENSWQDILSLMGSMALGALLWSILLFLISFLAAFFLYRWLRGRKLFDAPMNWYRYARWAWPVLFIVSAGLGSAYGGLWLGSGRSLNHAIREDKILDRTAVQLYCAFAMDAADYKITGNEKADEIKRKLEELESAGKKLHQEFRRDVDAALEEKGITGAKRWILNLFADCVEDSELSAYLSDNPGAMAKLIAKDNPIAAIPIAFEPLRDKACDLVHGIVYPNVYAGVGIGFGIPILLLGLFRFSLYYFITRKKKVAAKNS